MGAQSQRGTRTGRRYLCLHTPYLRTDRVRRDGDPAALDRPIVLTRRVGGSLIVEAACPAAAGRGVVAGMTLGQAQALVTELHAVESNEPADAALLAQLGRWALRFSPSVQPVAPDTLLVDITGCQRLFGGELSIARQAASGLLRQGLHARAAIADTVGAAWAAATSAGATVTIVPPGLTQAYLAELPPRALRLDSQTVERLETLGVRRIADLLALPRATLPARFGQQTVLRIRQALGEVSEPLEAIGEQEAPSADAAFESPVSEAATLQFVLTQLLEQLFRDIEARDLALCTLECVLIHEHAPPAVLPIRLSRPSRAWKHVTTLARQRLERAAPAEGVIGLRVVARETARWQGRQADLFVPHEPGSDEDFGCLVDRLVNRLGAAAVQRPVMRDDYQPEAAFGYVSAEQRGLGSLHPDELRTPPAGGPRPLRLLPRPEAMRVIALAPEGPPTWVGLSGRTALVARAWGPERIETGWWRGPDVRRDYFRVATESGEQLWVYHEPDSSRWYLHGYFV